MIKSSGRKFVRSATFVGVSALLVASCGGPGSETAGPPILSVYGDLPEMRLNQMDAEAGDQLTMLARMRFEVEGELPALDSSAPAYVISPAEPARDDVDMLLAIFGVEGELSAQTAQSGGGYFAGSADGSGPALYISGDAIQFWNYSPPWSQSTTNPACLDSEGIEPVAPPTPVIDSVVVADTEAPSDDMPGDDGTSGEEANVCPQEGELGDVPTEDEAVQMFSDLMSDIGVDVDDLDIEVFSDSYGASVSGFLRIGGVRSSLSWSVSYGVGSRITWAGGVLADTSELVDYPRIGTTAALERLNEQQSALVDQMSGNGDDLAASTGTSGVLVVRVLQVEEELSTLYGVDGSVYLVPGYAFLADPDEFGYRPRYTVSAIPDEYLDIVAPPMDEPSSFEPGMGGSESDDGMQDGAMTGGDMAQEITSEQANTLLGMSEAEATATAGSNGWVVRVAARDGEQFALTMDYNPKRVNLTIDGDVVTDVFIG